MKRDLWNMSDYHCPVIGTCLSIPELRRLAAKVQLILPERATDYELHGCFVSLAKAQARPARVVQKYLDKKFQRQMKRAGKARTDAELRAFWVALSEAGDIPGAFWSLMRHPLATDKLLAAVYGEVHMLSHLVGSTTRTELRRLGEAQAQVARLTEALEKRKRVLREAVAVWKSRTGDLEGQLAAERARREKAEHERISLRALLETRAVQELEAERDALRVQLDTALGRAERVESLADRLGAALEERTRTEAALRQTVETRGLELQALESAMLERLEAQCPAGCPGPECVGNCPAPSACLCPRLHGKRVLYVGGRSNLKSHYRALGERFGCMLLHHDGGVEQSPQHLQQLLSSADAVICPVDCVSHDACAAVKRLCRKCLKPVSFARTSGLSSLATALTELGGRQ